MDYRFAARMRNAPESFLKKLFDVSSDPEIISFAGGLPDSNLIDVNGIKDSAAFVLDEEGREALQYTTTEGHLPLREYIAERYQKRLGISASADNIRIVNGSQQCLDIIGKIFIEKNDRIGIESPGYLGAIEAFSLYEPVIRSVEMNDSGPDLNAFAQLISDEKIKFFYGIPNFQNPTGRSYSKDTRKRIGDIISETDSLFYEDDAFGELAFNQVPRVPVNKYAPANVIICGSFSKTVAPGMRIGWIMAPREIISVFDAAKQAADLHSNYLCQKIMNHYLRNSDYDRHLKEVVSVYSRNCRLICDLLDDMADTGITHTSPEGGMFMTVNLPEGLSSMKLFEEGIRRGVAVLPGIPFYAGSGGEDMIRLNFSNTDEENIKEGMARLSGLLTDLSSF
ncbi:MAG: PLP-dependent aminotransferase family protein [Methanomicrobiaceae archaeon]|nr:PLP-dependent aminotransferase family protein [Methanomicrobiaceae archaeon]